MLLNIASQVSLRLFVNIAKLDGKDPARVATQYLGRGRNMPARRKRQGQRHQVARSSDQVVAKERHPSARDVGRLAAEQPEDCVSRLLWPRKARDADRHRDLDPHVLPALHALSLNGEQDRNGSHLRVFRRHLRNHAIELAPLALLAGGNIHWGTGREVHRLAGTAEGCQV